MGDWVCLLGDWGIPGVAKELDLQSLLPKRTTPATSAKILDHHHEKCSQTFYSQGPPQAKASHGLLECTDFHTIPNFSDARGDTEPSIELLVISNQLPMHIA